VASLDKDGIVFAPMLRRDANRIAPKVLLASRSPQLADLRMVTAVRIVIPRKKARYVAVPGSRCRPQEEHRDDDGHRPPPKTRQ
jgi:hypothetical protein